MKATGFHNWFISAPRIESHSQLELFLECFTLNIEEKAGILNWKVDYLFSSVRYVPWLTILVYRFHNFWFNGSLLWSVMICLNSRHLPVHVSKNRYSNINLYSTPSMLLVSSGSWITLVTVSISASMMTASSPNDFQNIWTRHEIWMYSINGY